MKAQGDLLDELRERQGRAVVRAEGLGSAMPPDALIWMRAVLDEFRRKAVAQAPELLRRTMARLGAQAAAAPADAGPLQELAGAEEAILEDLARGAQPPPPSPERLSESAAATSKQGEVRRMTEALESQVRELSRDAGGLPAEVTEPLGIKVPVLAWGLGSADPGKALGHEQAALEQLEKGRQALEQAAQQQSRMESGLSRPFGSRAMTVRRVGGVSGADTGFVPLPSARDYQPPRELRRELERSLRERRPPAYDPAVQEYFRRMSE